MEAKKIHLDKDNETYLITLYGKALDNRTKNPILGDKFADEAVRRIDFDFENLKSPKGASVSLPVRAKHIDNWTREFLAANPDATVLHLGCGLDSRVFRIDPPATVRWYDVDFPEVIELRKKLYPDRHDYVMIGSSVTDPGWLDEIPADKPVIVVAEGLVQYIPEEEVYALFRRITGKFPYGQIIFDAHSELMIRFVMLSPAAKRSNVSLLWGLGDARVFEKAVPRLRLVNEISFLDLPELIERISPSRIGRMYYRLMSHIPAAKKMVRHLRYEF
jgi:O-methyltransferase involved in polyketide biosynthesis